MTIENKDLNVEFYHNSIILYPESEVINNPENDNIKTNEDIANQLRRAIRKKVDRSRLSAKEIRKEISCISTDAEYLPKLDSPTIPLVVTFGALDSDNSGESAHTGEYIHPNHPYTPEELSSIHDRARSLGESENCLKVFNQDIALMDYLKDGWGIDSRPLIGQRKKVFTIKLFIFWSFKDIEFLFKDTKFYRNEILPQLTRIRRITTGYGQPIALPYEIALPTERRKTEWHALSIEIVDISAMQGAKGLESYMLNVGLSTNDKKSYEKKDKSRMDLRLLEDVEKYLRYIRADVSLELIYMKTIEFFNKIAQLIGVEPHENWEWGLSTGKIVASIVSEWLANQVNKPVKDDIKTIIDSDNIKRTESTFGFYRYTRLSSPESIKQMSHLTGLKELLYLGMTDGGRCVKERPHINSIEGCLIDIDIAGCYANGLLNQVFPVGNPKILFKPMSWGDWEKKYKKLLVPGLWVGRVTWKNAPFRQDLIISKDDRQFGKWDFYQRQFNGENASDADVQYDVSMYLMAHDVIHGALTHDIYQVIEQYASNAEKAWIRENAIIECCAFYPSTEEVSEIDENILVIEDLNTHQATGFSAITKWVGIPFKNLMEILIPERNKHKSVMKRYEQGDKYKVKINKLRQETGIKSIEKILEQVVTKAEYDEYLLARSTQEFIKLINNTIYGCIASTFFATDGTGLSNYVVGNNITARARTLAWCMAKGLHMVMSVTDGGVYDLNKVLKYREKSLGILEGVSRDIFTDPKRNRTVDVVPLYGQCLEPEQMQSAVDGNDGFEKVENIAWKHLKSEFGDLDIFKHDQFSFEVKECYTNLDIRNKSDYRLYNALTKKLMIKVRGLKNNASDIKVLIFDDIQNGENNTHFYQGEEMLGLSDFRANRDTYQNLLPHDIISTNMSYTSYTPLGKRFINEEHRNTVLRLYEEYKKTGDNRALLNLSRLDDDDSDVEKIKTILVTLRENKKKRKKA